VDKALSRVDTSGNILFVTYAVYTVRSPNPVVSSDELLREKEPNGDFGEQQ
jgi:hypothetical protein